MKLKVLDLFSGIGGFSLGLERTCGFETVAFCEIDPYCQKVLKKHWPDVPIYDDVRTLNYDGPVDVICGGFPCQDISIANAVWGRREGIDGSRSGLVSEFMRLIAETNPQIVIMENSPGLRSRGLDRILRSFDALGYDVEWHCIPLGAVGAYQRRDRIWILAHRRGIGQKGVCELGQSERAPCPIITRSAIARAYNTHRGPGGTWQSKSGLDRVAYGVPGRSHRLKQLGNSAPPQIPEMIGHAILQAEAA